MLACIAMALASATAAAITVVLQVLFMLLGVVAARMVVSP